MKSNVAKELLNKLVELNSKGPIKIIEKYSAAGIGLAIEESLGIKMNSSKEPDYKGIELKTTQGKIFNTNKTLLAMVPDWKASPIHSYADLVTLYGYPTERSPKELNCSVNALSPNRQGLMLEVNEAGGYLEEWHITEDRERTLLLMWSMEKICRRFKEKHPETFWISAKKLNTKEFQITKILHVNEPKMANVDDLPNLFTNGSLFIDHVAHQKPDGKHRDHGMLFRTAKDPRDLFTVIGEYKLGNV